MIAKLADERNMHWYDVIKDVEFTCNNSVSKATNECPSMLLYSVCQRGKVIDQLLDALQINGQIIKNRDLTNLRKQASECIKKHQSMNERIYNRRHKIAKEYKVGDKVMIRNFDNSYGISIKLIP